MKNKAQIPSEFSQAVCNKSREYLHTECIIQGMKSGYIETRTTELKLKTMIRHFWMRLQRYHEQLNFIMKTHYALCILNLIPVSPYNMSKISYSCSHFPGRKIEATKHHTQNHQWRSGLPQPLDHHSNSGNLILIWTLLYHMAFNKNWMFIQ